MKCRECPFYSRPYMFCEKEGVVCKDRPYEIHTQEPSLFDKAINLGTAVVKHAINGFQEVSPDVLAKRLEICSRCDHRSQDQYKICHICGCPVETKARWASEECPIGNWKRGGEGAASEAQGDLGRQTGGCGCG